MKKCWVYGGAIAAALLIGLLLRREIYRAMAVRELWPETKTEVAKVKWEYRSMPAERVRSMDGFRINGTRVVGMDMTLWKMGGDGWELVGPVGNELVFKRQTGSGPDTKIEK